VLQPDERDSRLVLLGLQIVQLGQLHDRRVRRQQRGHLIGNRLELLRVLGDPLA